MDREKAFREVCLFAKRKTGARLACIRPQSITGIPDLPFPENSGRIAGRTPVLIIFSAFFPSY
jgi:hypothetical protein